MTVLVDSHRDGMSVLVDCQRDGKSVLVDSHRDGMSVLVDCRQGWHVSCCRLSTGMTCQFL